MNKIFRQLTKLSPPKEVKPKRTTPVTLCFNENGYCLGKLEGSDVDAAFIAFPDATSLNIVPIRGKTKVVIKNS